MEEREQTLRFEEATVTVPMPPGAEFSELDGLEEGARHLTWAPGPEGFFMISAGTSAGHTADGLLAGEGQRGRALRVESDEPARSRAKAPGGWRSGSRTSGRASCMRALTVPEREVRELSDLLFIPGERQHLRIG